MLSPIADDRCDQGNTAFRLDQDPPTSQIHAEQLTQAQGKFTQKLSSRSFDGLIHPQNPSLPAQP